jgi:hypothetical protein
MAAFGIRPSAPRWTQAPLAEQDGTIAAQPSALDAQAAQLAAPKAIVARPADAKR